MSDEIKRAPHLSSAQMDALGHQLTARQAASHCVMCHVGEFGIVSLLGFQNLHNTADVLNGIINEPQQIPVVARICTNCGFVATHALGVLGYEDLKPGVDA